MQKKTIIVLGERRSTRSRNSLKHASSSSESRCRVRSLQTMLTDEKRSINKNRVFYSSVQAARSESRFVILLLAKSTNLIDRKSHCHTTRTGKAALQAGFFSSKSLCNSMNYMNFLIFKRESRRTPLSPSNGKHSKHKCRFNLKKKSFGNIT